MAGERGQLSSSDIRSQLRQHPGQALLNFAEIDRSAGAATATVDNLSAPRHGYLKGHSFRGEIVTPGVVQVKMTRDLARLYALAGEADLDNDYLVTSVDARFRGLLHPEDKIAVILKDAKLAEGRLTARGQVIKDGETKPAVATTLTLVRADLFRSPSRESHAPFSPPETVLYRGEALDALLPQKPPFRLVESISELQPGEKGVGELVNTYDRSLQYLLFNLRGFRYVDPVYLIEGAAQIGTAVALSMPENQGLIPLFGGIKGLEVHNLLGIGEKARLEVVVTNYKRAEGKPGGIGQGRIDVTRADGAPVLTGGLSFATAHPDSLGQTKN